MVDHTIRAFDADLQQLASKIAETVYYIVERNQLTEKRPKADVTSKKPLPLAAD